MSASETRSVRTLEHWVPAAREVLRVSGVRALLYRLRRLAFRSLPWGGSIELPVAADDVLAADWTRPAEQASNGRVSTGGGLAINWVLPAVVVGSGGHTTIFRVVRFLERRGHVCRLYLYNPPGRTSFREQVDTVRRAFQPMQAEIHPYTPDMEPCDALVATMWQTAYAVRNSPARARRFYFVQDFEPSFYPAGSESVLAANTYRFGFHGITAGSWLSTRLAQEYGMACDHFELGCDTSDYHNEGRRLRPGVVFYARPGTPWRGFELGVMAIELFHRRHPEFQIHMIGRSLGRFRLPFPFESHGNLSHEQLNALYNACSAGLVLSFTNMSLVPLELLAAGCIPVVNDAPNNRMVLDSPYVQYADASPQALATTLSAAVERADLQDYAAGASESVVGRSWDEAGATVERILVRELGVGAR